MRMMSLFDLTLTLGSAIFWLPTLLGAALIRAPWITLLAVSALYLGMLPFAFASYQKVKRRRASAAVPASADAETVLRG